MKLFVKLSLLSLFFMPGLMYPAAAPAVDWRAAFVKAEQDQHESMAKPDAENSKKLVRSLSISDGYYNNPALKAIIEANLAPGSVGAWIKAISDVNLKELKDAFKVALARVGDDNVGVVSLHKANPDKAFFEWISKPNFIDAQSMDKLGQTALQYAIVANSLPAINTLIKYGATNAPSRKGKTPVKDYLVRPDVTLPQAEKDRIAKALGVA